MHSIKSGIPSSSLLYFPRISLITNRLFLSILSILLKFFNVKYSMVSSEPFGSAKFESRRNFFKIVRKLKQRVFARLFGPVLLSDTTEY